MSDRFNQSEKVTVVNNNPPIKEPKQAKRNTLTHNQFFQLCEWLRNKEEKIRGCVWTYGDLQAAAGTDLKFTVSRNALEEASKATGVVWKTPNKSSKEINRSAGQMLLINAVRVLIKDQIELRTKLGEPVSDGLQKLADHYDCNKTKRSTGTDE